MENSANKHGIVKLLVYPILIALLGGGGILTYIRFVKDRSCPGRKQIIGYLKFENDKLPVDNALIEITSDSIKRTTHSDKQGKFEFDISRTDSVLLEISYNNLHETVSRRFNFCSKSNPIELKSIFLKVNQPDTKKSSLNKNKPPIKFLFSSNLCDSINHKEINNLKVNLILKAENNIDGTLVDWGEGESGFEKERLINSPNCSLFPHYVSHTYRFPGEKKIILRIGQNDQTISLNIKN